MTKIPLKPAFAALAAAAAALLAACGSTRTETVTVTTTTTVPASTSSTSTSRTRTSTTPKSSSTTTTSTNTTPASTSTSTSTSSTRTTRTETCPAFVHTNTTPAGELGDAVALLRHRGYDPVTTATYDTGDTLRVLIGRASGGERAFFFDQDTYLGTDASAASAQISVLRQSDTEVTLGYGIFAAGASSPSGVRRVHFALDMGKLSALDPIPPVSQRR